MHLQSEHNLFRLYHPYHTYDRGYTLLRWNLISSATRRGLLQVVSPENPPASGLAVSVLTPARCGGPHNKS